jgi:hypothetical protein
MLCDVDRLMVTPKKTLQKEDTTKEGFPKGRKLQNESKRM